MKVISKSFVLLKLLSVKLRELKYKSVYYSYRLICLFSYKTEFMLYLQKYGSISKLVSISIEHCQKPCINTYLNSSHIS